MHIATCLLICWAYTGL